MDWIYYLILALLLMGGLLLNLASLPGLWLMVLSACGYAWLTGMNYIGAKTLIALVVLGLIAEAVELLAGSAAAKGAGGSKRAAIGAIIGALLGAFLLTFGVPIIGTVIGACLGAFGGGLIAEFTTGRGTGQSVRVGVAAAKGRFIGIVAKSTFGVLMMLLTLGVGLPIRFNSAPPPAPVTMPSSIPTTTTAPTTLP